MQGEMIQGLGAPPVRGDAVMSEDGRYRYVLSRTWEPGVYKLPFIMLNPSTATATEDDPTIRRCMAFARREGWGGIAILNLFAFRATKPSDMRAADDPVGPFNDAWMEQAMQAPANIPVVAAWGVHGSFLNRADTVKAAFEAAGRPLWCLGKTKDGHPKHPLYLSSTTPLERL